jgi:peptidoglycan/xylan/chitin deacetylase (PgdA/CDA1 family)
VRSPIKAGIQRILAEMPRRVGGRTVALCYHSVSTVGTRASTEEALFRSHLSWIAEHCRVVPFAELPRIARRPDGSRPTVAITFDDGYEDNHRYALPALADLGLTATFFITSGLIDGDRATAARMGRVWGAADMGRLRSMTWGQIEELQASGMTIGAHTRTHPNLRALSHHEAREEIRVSKYRLEEQMGRAVNTFAYPFGDARFHLSENTIDLVRQCGFLAAGTIHYRPVSAATDPGALPRFPVSNDPPTILEAKIEGRLDVIGAWREHAPAWVSGPLSRGRRRAREAV